MKKKYNYGTNQLFNFARDSYLERTSRPIYAIVFLVPFIIFYELGTIFINTDILNQSQVRVVAFVWLQDFLEYLGFASKFAWIAPPLAVIVILLAFQIASGTKWYFWFGDVVPMIVECAVLAIPLIVFSLFLSSSPVDTSNRQSAVSETLVRAGPAITCSIANGYGEPAAGAGGNFDNQNMMASIVTGIGAGIYEELVFRLILICVLMLLFQDILKLEQKLSIILSVFVSAALFSAHHHIVLTHGYIGQSIPFNWTAFGFRTMAGVYFAGLYAIRGFGITAGTHAFYDIIAVLINGFFFEQ